MLDDRSEILREVGRVLEEAHDLVAVLGNERRGNVGQIGQRRDECEADLELQPADGRAKLAGGVAELRERPDIGLGQGQPEILGGHLRIDNALAARDQGRQEGLPGSPIELGDGRRLLGGRDGLVVEVVGGRQDQLVRVLDLAVRVGEREAERLLEVGDRALPRREQPDVLFEQPDRAERRVRSDAKVLKSRRQG